MTTVEIVINAEKIQLAIEPRESLADVLREKRFLTSVHLGCEHGACGACTIVLDGKAVRSCLTLAVMCEGRAVATLEGLLADPPMTLLRRHFHEKHALQCGFCTPGMLIMARDLLLRTADLTESKVREGMAGHICRCTGYAGIIRAILAAADDIRASDTKESTSQEAVTMEREST